MLLKTELMGAWCIALMNTGAEDKNVKSENVMGLKQTKHIQLL